MKTINPRIGIIGGGPAGISLAKLLKQRGFRSVIILEKSDQAGGKAHSVSVADSVYNFGACYVTAGYGQVRRWLKDKKVESKRLDKATYISKDGHKIEFVASLMAEFGLRAALFQTLKYTLLWLEYAIRTKFGGELNRTYRHELATPAYEWFSRRNLPFLIKSCRRAFQVMGYGTLEDTPILHVLRWVTPLLLLSGMLNLIWEVKDFQSLFVQLAQDLDVRYAAPAQTISPASANGYLVTTPHETFHFDMVVVACCLDEAPSGLAAIVPSITAISPHLCFKQWVVSLCKIRRHDGSPFYTDRVVNFPDSWEERLDGKITAFRKSIFRAADSASRDDLYLCYQLYSDARNYGAEHSRMMLAHGIQERGGVLEDLVLSFTTRYAPTYTPEAIATDLLIHMREMQGQRQIYFTGATFCHESVRDVVNHNRGLARQIAADCQLKMSLLPRLLAWSKGA